ncbi:hypothetical protein [Inmirania thermothiophila]|uniref:Uncharacterized protein n=1 Tax=Inmirania thermothiophila TaxID=1750597 RepID=A0A3N1Y6Z6_9GAMM|nr:hypothetical protein [Inmirania thermothiophila]ROR34583.1 hypothetical protein EDC57_0481 [Inmirania thermothiophila]
MGAWGCPHESGGRCMRVNGIPCDPGMKGCILYGRVTFSKAEKNPPRLRRALEKQVPPRRR